MGATALYHPVSLMSIRYAAAYGGFKLGRLSQLAASVPKGTARYRCALVELNDSVRGKDPAAVKEALMGCFAEDITVVGVWYGRKGWSCELSVKVEAKVGSR